MVEGGVAVEIAVVTRDVELLTGHAVVVDLEVPERVQEDLGLGVHGVPLGAVPAGELGAAGDAVGAVKVARGDEIAVERLDRVGVRADEAATNGLPGAAVPTGDVRAPGRAGDAELTGGVHRGARAVVVHLKADGVRAGQAGYAERVGVVLGLGGARCGARGDQKGKCACW